MAGVAGAVLEQRVGLGVGSGVGSLVAGFAERCVWAGLQGRVP